MPVLTTINLESYTIIASFRANRMRPFGYYRTYLSRPRRIDPCALHSIFVYTHVCLSIDVPLVLGSNLVAHVSSRQRSETECSGRATGMRFSVGSENHAPLRLFRLGHTGQSPASCVDARSANRWAGCTRVRIQSDRDALA